MSVEAFLILLTMFSVITSLVTEAAKKVYAKTASNVVVLACSIIVSTVGSVIYFIFSDTIITPKTVCFALLLIVANWLSSMVGYDKVMQTLAQIGVKK